jgi:acyl-CoA thioester hydrolase
VDWLDATLDGPLFAESGPVLAHATCDFQQPLTYPATLVIDVYATPPGESSLKTVYDAALKRSEERVAVGTAVLVRKQREHPPAIEADYYGLDVPDRYVFGCGMDLHDYHRQLPGIYAI